MEQKMESKMNDILTFLKIQFSNQNSPMKKAGTVNYN